MLPAKSLILALEGQNAHGDLSGSQLNSHFPSPTEQTFLPHPDLCTGAEWREQCKAAALALEPSWVDTSPAAYTQAAKGKISVAFA